MGSHRVRVLFVVLALWALGACATEGGSGAPDVDIPSGDVRGDGDGGMAADVAGPPDVAPDLGDEGVAALVEEGKRMLAAGESASAHDTFLLALRRAPADPDALWGASLAELQMWVGLLDSALGLVARTQDPDAAGRKDAPGLFENGIVGDILAGMLDQLAAQQQRLDALKAQPAATFVLDSLPLALGGATPLRLSGEWDVADVHSLSALTRIVQGALMVLESWSWDVGLDALEDALDDISHLGRAWGALRVQHPGLLSLRAPSEAPVQWAAARESIRQGALDLLEAQRLMAAETDDQGDDVATLGAWGSVDVLVLRGRFGEGAESLSLLWHGRELSLRDSMERLAAHLDGDGASRVRLGRDLLLTVGLLVDVFHRTVGLDTLLASFGVELPAAVGGLLGMLDPENPEAVVTLLPQMLTLLGLRADDIELDLAAFLDRPVGLADILPNLGTDPLLGTPDFLRSFECLRLGFRDGDWQPGAPLRVVVHDPLCDEAPEISFTAGGLAGTAPLVPVEGFQGLLLGEIETPAEAQAVALRYTRGELVAELAREPGEDAVVFAMDADCAQALTWDGPHFGEPEFSEARELVEGQWEALSPADPDGVALPRGYLAFGSPSLGGLLWLAGAEGMAPADQSALNQLIAAVLDGIESF